MTNTINVLICLEVYRTPEQTYSEDDYVVDGIKLFNLPLLMNSTARETENFSEQMRAEVLELTQYAIKQMIEAFKGTNSIQQMFPRASKIIREGQPHWFHVTTPQALSKRPQEFNSGGFSEAELLGTSDAESELEAISIYFNSDGEEIEAPPDKFMLSIGAA